MKIFEYLLHYNLGYTVRIKRKELTLKRGIFWIQHDQCGHSEWNIAIGSAGEYLSRNCHERAESFSDRSEKGKYRSLKCWNLEYYHPSEVHPHTSAICMHTMFEQAPVSGLAITCMKTVLEHITNSGKIALKRIRVRAVNSLGGILFQVLLCPLFLPSGNKGLNISSSILVVTRL